MKKGPEVPFFKFPYKGKPLAIAVWGDTHLYARNCALKDLKKCRDRIKKRFPDVLNLHVGDVFDYRYPGHKFFDITQTNFRHPSTGEELRQSNWKRQHVKAAAEFFKTFGPWLAIISGNHGAGGQKAGDDMARDMAELLGAPWLGTGGTFRILLRSGRRTASKQVAMCHGGGTGQDGGHTKFLQWAETEPVGWTVGIHGHSHQMISRNVADLRMLGEKTSIEYHFRRTVLCVPGWQDSVVPGTHTYISKNSKPRAPVGTTYVILLHYERSAIGDYIRHEIVEV